MYTGVEDQKLEYYKVGAALFGVDIDGKKKEENVFEFKDPSEYENMTMEERKKLTETMMGAHKNWAQQEGLKDADS